MSPLNSDIRPLTRVAETARSAAAWISHDGRARNIVVVVCALVVGARIALALLTPAPAVVLDAAGYDQAARRLVEEGFYAYTGPEATPDAWPNARTLPGYPFFLAALYGLTSGSAGAQPLVSIAQALLSGIMLWGVYLIGKRLSGEVSGVAALLLATVYAPFWFSYRYVLTEDLFMTIAVWGMYLLLVLRREHRVWRAARLGAALGLAAATATYVRAAGIVWLTLAGVLTLVLDRRRWRTHLLAGAAAGLVFIVCMSPWWIRNARIYDRFVPFSTMTASGALIATYDTPAEAFRAEKELMGSPFSTPADELERERLMAEKARQRRDDQLRDDPGRYLYRKARYTAISVLTYHPNPFGGFRGWGGVVEALHLSLLLLGALGLTHLRRSVDGWLVASFPFALLALHLNTLVFSRYLFPMMPFVIALAGVGVATILGASEAPSTDEEASRRHRSFSRPLFPPRKVTKSE